MATRKTEAGRSERRAAVSLVTQQVRSAVGELFRELDLVLAAGSETIGEGGVIEQAETVCRLKEAADLIEDWGGRGVIEQAMTLCRDVFKRYEAVMP